MLLEYIKSDLMRYAHQISFKLFLKHYFISPGFKYMFYFRICQRLKAKKLFFLYPFFRLILWRYSFKFGFAIPVATSIGYGFYIGHFGIIVINSSSIIGNNCNVSQGITIGFSPSPNKYGSPVIGNNVFIGPGAVVMGKIYIGDNVAIGANAVVTKGALPNQILVGIPARVLSEGGSGDYILHKYEVKG